MLVKRYEGFIVDIEVHEINKPYFKVKLCYIDVPKPQFRFIKKDKMNEFLSRFDLEDDS